MKLLQSFASKKFVNETFNWQFYYYSLTDAGIEYLREYLGLPKDIVPATMKNTTAPKPLQRFGGDDRKKYASGGRNPEFQKREGGREGYRRKPQA